MSTPRPPPPPRHQQHLYLVLEGSDDLYSIHKIDVRDFDPDDDDLVSRARPLPDPPLLRLAAAESNCATCFVAHGTNIFAMPPSPGRADLALDTRTMTITGAPLPQANTQQFHCCGLFVVGDRIYSMDEREEDDKGSCNFEVLRFDSGSRCSSSSSSRCWSWSSVPSPPRSSRLAAGGNDAGITFSFDTEAAKWTFRGYWRLPFHGQAHYDVELDAWVGLHGECHRKGRVSCCDVLPPATGDESIDRHQQAPPWKLARDGLFRAKGSRHRGGALVYMGSSTFCVVERVMEKELTREQWKKLDGPPRLLFTCGRSASSTARPGGCGWRRAAAGHAATRCRPVGGVDFFFFGLQSDSYV
ncbi:hypothetical protein BAE44_0001110 [Dichanthelium oligosanthes]|uniref:Uncharacterized protein n=1 Tax=Dichanthelium oligosanthes TaxID=888268 RepID=A0A1E5WKJ0_9POAL|nr:hypothetical protein BAE44_0001110 [Dichanthelium oligosanthes]